MNRTILEKAIVHLLNGDQDKAEAFFHKFIVEKARHIHESLRQDEDVDLNDGWDKEVKEEEYFGGDDLSSAEDDEGEDAVGDVDDGMEAGSDEGGDDAFSDDDTMDPDAEGELDTGEEDFGGEEGDLEADEGDIEGKIDGLEDKIDQLTAEFDRMMSALEDHEGEGDEFGEPGEDDFGDDEFNDTDVQDSEGEEPHMDADDGADLADRMDTDMGEDGEQPEDETMESMDSYGDDLDEELADITESVLSELEKVTMPSRTEDGKEIGSGGKKVSGATNTDGMLPKHPVNDRIAGAKPYTPKGGTRAGANDSFERETAPGVKPVSDLVKGARNSRSKWQDGTSHVSHDGDSSAALNHDFAGGGEKKSNSPVDGKMKPRTK